MVDVTDIFDAFHRVAETLWREFGAELASAAADEDSAGYDELIDQLEVDLFLPACARRLRQATGEYVDSDHIAAGISLLGPDGQPLPGATGRYQSHAFHPVDLGGDVPNAILTGDLMSVPREGLRLQLSPISAAARLRSRRGDLPIH